MKQKIGAWIVLLVTICVLLVVHATAAPNYVQVNDVWKGIPDGSLIYNGIIKGETGFDTIQKGINAVEPGGEVFVWPGIYHEDLDVNKSVILLGYEYEVNPAAPGTMWVGNTVIVASSSGGFLGAGYSPYISASNVVLMGFKVNGTSPGMYIGGDSVTMNNVLVQNCELTGRTEAGIIVSDRNAFGNMAEITLNQLWSHDNPSGNGVLLYNIEGVGITNSLIQKNGLSTGTAEKQFGIWVTGNTGGIEIGNTITGNNFTGNQGGSILISPNIGQTVSSMAIQQNKFLDPGLGVKNDGFPTFIDGTANWWDAVCHANVAIKTVGLVDYDPWFVNPEMTVLSSDPAVLPVAGFIATPDEGDLPLMVTFTDQSTSESPINSWNWSFGDGTFSALQSPSHQYSVAGVYNSKLTVSNCFGSNVSAVTEIEAGVRPMASFVADPINGDAPLTVVFNDTSTTPAGVLNSWNWSFGDGNFSNSQNATHTYDAAGTYQVKLVVKNDFDIADNATKNIVVSVPLPTPDFVADKLSGSAPLTVSFTDLSTSYALYPITGWTWEFGDGGSNTLQDPSYVYLTYGTYDVTLHATNEGGSNATTKHAYITVNPPKPKADFTGTPRSGAAPLEVQFNDISTGVVDSREWDFGDGNKSNDKDPIHIYGAQGTYTVKLKASNAGGSDNEKKDGYISVIGAPEANFTRTPSIGGAPMTVSFTDISTGNPTKWAWDFDDGGTSNEKNPIHEFTSVGTYNVTLKASNDGGSTEKSRVVRVISLPVASFTGTPVLGTVPLTVQFNDTSTVIRPVFWQWDFGDGTGAVAAEIDGEIVGKENQNPLHTYNKPGSYNVTLTIENPAGSSVPYTRYGYITVVTTPVASFTTEPDPAEGNAPLVVRFFDTSSGTPRLVSWDFGDGTTSTDKNPVHLFTRGGVYNVTLTAQNMAGWSTATKQVKVKVLPIASFVANPTSGVGPLAVQFTDTSTGVPTRWSWNFGDGNTSSDHYPVHTYAAPGTYSVSLKVTNNAGSDQVTQPNCITVKVPLRSSFTYTTSNSDNTAPLMVSFTDTSPDHPTTWEWEFGDGSTSTEQDPVHIYLNPGNYLVKQKVTNFIEWGSSSQSIQVNAPLIADFKAEPTMGSGPLTVFFQDMSIGSGITQWEWDFGDLQYYSTTNPAAKNPAHTYHDEGLYTVSLNVSRGAVSNTTEKVNLVTVLPFP
ncbi:MAG: PKD domain-containing protein [Methanoregulaceae archaeon]|nr:PKD domain-containing protein [Methanoregulaceae archaeon]